MRTFEHVSGKITIREGKLLSKLARENKSLDSLEIGSWKGKSSCYIAEGIVPNNKLYCVDWFPDGIEQDFRKNIEENCFGSFVICLNRDSYSFNPKKERIGKVGFIFIDGDHSYNGVKNDYDKSIDLLETNGVIAFHDSYGALGVRRLMFEILFSGKYKKIGSVKSITYATKADGLNTWDWIALGYEYVRRTIWCILIDINLALQLKVETRVKK